MKSQPNCIEVVVVLVVVVVVVAAVVVVVIVVVVVVVVVDVVDVVFVVVFVFNVDIVVKATSKVDLRLLVMGVEFVWGGVGWGGWCANPFSCQTQLG